jgi:hypothetical protein
MSERTFNYPKHIPRQVDVLIEIGARAILLVKRSDVDIVREYAKNILTYAESAAVELGFSDVVYQSRIRQKCKELYGDDILK